MNLMQRYEIEDQINHYSTDYKMLVSLYNSLREMLSAAPDDYEVASLIGEVTFCLDALEEEEGVW